MPEFLAIIILGIVEGITEFLPVSSTGHLLLVEHIRGISHQTDLFNVVIQAAAVIAVIPLFPQRIGQLLRAPSDPEARDYLMKFMAAFMITGVGGVLMEKLHFKLPEKMLPIAIAMLVGGILFLLVERFLRGKEQVGKVTWTVAVAIGLGQLIAAIFPGASRSGVTILLALMLGMSRPAATEFTFLVGIPTMLAASALKIFKALHHPPPGAPAENWGMILLGCVVSAIVSFIVVRWLLRYVQNHTFELFGWYRIVVGIVILVLAFTYGG